MVRVDEFGGDGENSNNPRAACSFTLVFFKIEENTSLSEVSTEILFIRLGTKGGRENILRTSKYGNMSKVCMREGNYVQSNALLIIMVSPVIRIMIVSVVSSDTSLNNSDTNGGSRYPDFVLLSIILHLVEKRDEIFQDPLYDLSQRVDYEGSSTIVPYQNGSGKAADTSLLEEAGIHSTTQVHQIMHTTDGSDLLRKLSQSLQSHPG